MTRRILGAAMTAAVLLACCASASADPRFTIVPFQPPVAHVGHLAGLQRDAAGDQLTLTCPDASCTSLDATWRPAGGVPGLPQTIATGGTSNVKLAMDASGDALLVVSTAGQQLRYALAAPRGVFKPFKAITNTARVGSFDAALTPAGGAVVLWTRFTNAGTYVQALTRSPAGVVSPIQTMTPTTDESSAAGLAAGPDGDVLATWVQRTPAGHTPQAAALAGDHFALPADTLGAGAPGMQDQPAAAVGPGGAAIVAWSENIAGFRQAVRYAVRDARTDAWSPPTDLAASAYAVTAPAVAIDAAGTAVAIWGTTTPPGQGIMMNASRPPHGSFSVPVSFPGHSWPPPGPAQIRFLSPGRGAAGWRVQGSLLSAMVPQPADYAIEQAHATPLMPTTGDAFFLTADGQGGAAIGADDPGGGWSLSETSDDPCQWIGAHLGTPGDDHLGGGSGVFCGLGGNDTIAASTDDSLLVGGLGNDTLTGSGFADEFNGGPGTDTVSYANYKPGITASIGGARGDDGFGPYDRDTIDDDVENLIGGKGPDTLTGTDGPNQLTGGPGNDAMQGLGGNDTLWGGGGADQFLGGAGNDALKAHDSAADALLDCGDGTDTLQWDAGLDPAGTGCETVTGG
jgi:hypothetical protein